MIRGSTYSALLHLTILAAILFGLPSLTLVLPKWQSEEKPIPVVVMPESEAEKLAKRSPAGPKQQASPKPDTSAKSQTGASSPSESPEEMASTRDRPAPKPPETSSLIGGISTVTSAEPESKSEASQQEAASKALPEKKDANAPALPQTVPPPTPQPIRPELPSKDAAAPRIETETSTSPPTPPTTRQPDPSIVAIIAEMTAKLPRLKSLREELIKDTDQKKFNPAIAKSAERMQKMSEEGYAHAQFSLSEMYLTGEGVQKDQEKAVKLLNRAAISGYLPAQLTLGMLAAEGRGMQQNLAEAHTWLALAAEQGIKSAAEALPKLEKRMGTRDVVEARKRSFQLRKVLVIIHGADLKKASKTELSERLRIAAALGDDESVHVLLAQGADADGPDRDGRTAIIEAAWRGYPRIVKTLIDNGASLSAADETGKNAVMWAAINGHAAVIKSLIEVGAPINERDNEGISALMRAAWNGHAEAVRALLAAKADINLVDKRGLRAVDYAKRSNNRATVEILARAR